MILNKTVTGIILVAGNSTRFGQNRNKNFELVNGKTILSYSINAFTNNKYIDNIIVVIKKDDKFYSYSVESSTTYSYGNVGVTSEMIGMIQNALNGKTVHYIDKNEQTQSFVSSVMITPQNVNSVEASSKISIFSYHYKCY